MLPIICDQRVGDAWTNSIRFEDAFVEGVQAHAGITAKRVEFKLRDFLYNATRAIGNHPE